MHQEAADELVCIEGCAVLWGRVPDYFDRGDTKLTDRASPAVISIFNSQRTFQFSSNPKKLTLILVAFALDLQRLAGLNYLDKENDSQRSSHVATDSNKRESLRQS